ncbi:proton-associated sugar transporter A [Diorhabda carinulata]|uniref:proton-associated sugar transporter A n=1 Tax=Diorhabda carinulata TaxID=1163345 RepID=UPI0025A270C0|nr:proton-associated sugar transporter A [Diorhabda carinulata]
MAEKLYEYQGFIGRFHTVREHFREKYLTWKESNPQGVIGFIKKKYSSEKHDERDQEDYSHIYRKKTGKELVRISAAVMGIEFSYAAETAFVSPTLLKIGVKHKHMTLVWALSPLIGFFLTPILGSLSDRCHSMFGRRRPFIFLMSVGVLIGLILVPNGEHLGYTMGDIKPPNMSYHRISSHRTSALKEATISPILPNNSLIYNDDNNESNNMVIDRKNDFLIQYNNSHPWGVFFTILGTVLLDFDADACQSPARAYLLDVTVPDDHARGLSTFTVMAGLGGFFGYALGGINWDVTFIGELLGGHVRAVFTLITFIFVICVGYTITSFKEIPLTLLELSGANFQNYSCYENEGNIVDTEDEGQSYGTIGNNTNDKLDERKNQYSRIEDSNASSTQEGPRKSIVPDPNASLLLYLQSIIYMPNSIRILCLTNLFCWMAHVCYSLYFTDFVGEAVFNGDPTAISGTSRELYESGVRFGCWGMSMYSLSCACYSTKIEKLITVFGAKKVYVGGLLVYSTGMFLMAITKHKVGVILFSWTAGVMYSTLFTMPYLIIAHYHAKSTFETTTEGEVKISTQIRGLGTDVALVSSMVFLAQFILSMCMGTIVSVSGTTTAVVGVASMLAFFGAISATQVLYLDL